MRKLITLIALLLIAAALLGPGLTGRLAERTLAQNNDSFAASLPDWLMLVEPRFERGWFRSKSRFRLVVTDPERFAMASRVLGASDFADEPALIVDSVVTHGPLVGIFTPALARVDSVFLTDTESGALRPLPLSLISTFGLTGNSRLEWWLSAGGIGTGDRGMRWQSMTITQDFGRTLSRSTVRIEAPQMSFANAGQTTEFEDLRITSLLTRERGVLRVDSDYGVRKLAAEASPAASVDGSVAIAGLHEFALAGLREPVRDLMRAAPQARAALIDEHLPALLAVLGDALALDWAQQLRADAGDMHVELHVDFPPSSAITATTSANLALRQVTEQLSARLELQMSSDLAQRLAENDAQLGRQLTMLQGMGVLVPDQAGDSLAMKLDYAGGSLTVNGLPVPMSLTSAP